MTVLGIETSCDETSIALLKIKNKKIKVLSNIVSSQIKLHKKYGGVWPFLAKREHQKNLIPVLKKSLKKAGLLLKEKKEIKINKIKILKKILKREKELFENLKFFLENFKKPKIDLIAVCVGPGLDPCLWQGINFARALAFFWKKKVVAVNHIEAHYLINLLEKKNLKDIFPALALVASGGHTQLILVKKIGKQKTIGKTLDDAAGECLDKTARILGFEYPGGPSIEKEAKKIKKPSISFSLPRPMINSKNYNFSFSGLKTAVLYKIKEKKIKDRNFKIKMAFEIQQAVIDVLIKKTIKALKGFGPKSLLGGGGVLANKNLRKQLKSAIKKEKLNIKIFLPPKKFCTDNALMIALAGFFRRKEKKFWQKIKAKANWEI